jgi:hypothetical protein
MRRERDFCKMWGGKVCGLGRRAGVARNFALVRAAMDRLGGVPELVGPEDFSEGGPDDKVVALSLAYLAGRLLEASREERAAHTIQKAWDRHRRCLPGGERLLADPCIFPMVGV